MHTLKDVCEWLREIYRELVKIRKIMEDWRKSNGRF